MTVTNPKLKRLIYVLSRYLNKLLSLIHYTGILTLVSLDNESFTYFLISIFIILFIIKKSD
jgi:hypothetical protein